MLKRWIFYLTALLGCAVFWSAYQGWIAWMLLQTILWLPWFSLLLSLIPMLSLRPKFIFPKETVINTVEQVTLNIHSWLFQPPYLCRLEARHTLTGELMLLAPGEHLPTAHCGELLITFSKLYVYDLLGLFRLPLKKPEVKSVLVRPSAIPAENPGALERLRAHSWVPKPGGGFGENHELRLYRPGDSLNQIHWKLTAKTGKLMIREPMVPRSGNILLTMDISGTAAELDLKFGRLLWMGEYLTELELPFEIRALSGDGLLTLQVNGTDQFHKAIDRLLCCSPVASGSIRHADPAASWHFHIGGEPDEA